MYGAPWRLWSIHGARGARRDALKYGGEAGIQWSAAEDVDSYGRLVKARSPQGCIGVTWILWSGGDSAKHVKHRGA